MIDYQNIVKNPKPLIGFSDVTALLQAIFKETGLVGFHGPVGSTLEDRYSVKNLKKILFKPYDIYPLHNAKLNKELSDVETYKPYTLTPGKISGILVGGNLTLINAMIGTQHAFEFKNRLVFIEDIEEAPYRIDRMLTQLIDATDFTEAKAIIFGVCKGCDKEKSATQFTLKEVLKERIAPLGIPAAYGLSFGHVAQNMTLPFGVKAEFDALKRTLTLLESPVV